MINWEDPQRPGWVTPAPGWRFECRHCGTFVTDDFELSHLVGYLNPPDVPGLAKNPLQVKRHRAVLAYALRRMEAAGKTPTLVDGMTLRILKEDRLLSLGEQRDKVLVWLGRAVDISSASTISWDSHGARFGSDSPGAFRLLLESLLDQHLVQGRLSSDGTGTFQLAHRGLERLEQLERTAPSGYNAFMAMQYGDAILNRVVDEYFRTAVKETGFQLLRLDDRPEAGLIDARLRNEIRNCRFLIADLSHANAGSYWEAGYAEGLGKPVIYTCERSVFEGKATIAKPHFDTNHHLTIAWHADNPRPAADQLKETIRFTIPEARLGS
jgi:hypothetical protein